MPREDVGLDVGPNRAGRLILLQIQLFREENGAQEGTEKYL